MRILNIEEQKILCGGVIDYQEIVVAEKTLDILKSCLSGFFSEESTARIANAAVGGAVSCAGYILYKPYMQRPLHHFFGI
ncbi:MAG TPA: hypothetical protein VFP93_05005 [Gammaproteobacteria bacterium]|nr:hypothetical protein [Gammaproteobacteria bacterium]